MLIWVQDYDVGAGGGYSIPSFRCPQILDGTQALASTPLYTFDAYFWASGTEAEISSLYLYVGSDSAYK